MGIAAALPVLGMFASWGRYLSDERDEYHRSVTLQRIAIATNVTMGARRLGFPPGVGAMPLVEAYWIPLVWIAVQGAFGCFTVRPRRASRLIIAERTSTCSARPH